MLALLLLCLLPTDFADARCSTIEINRYGWNDGAQVIYWSDYSGVPHVREWRWLSGGLTIDRQADGTWIERRGDRLIRARRFIETTTEHDPERWDARVWERRRGL